MLKLLAHSVFSSPHHELCQDLTLALSLVRPLRLLSDVAFSSEHTNEKYGLVPRIYIVCDQDNVYHEDFQRWMVENNPTDEIKMITGSDHMVMFSKPRALCSCLQDIEEKYFLKQLICYMSLYYITCFIQSYCFILRTQVNVWICDLCHCVRW